MERFINTLPSIFELEEFLSGWFLGAPPSSIRRDNLIEFVAYGFYSRRVEDLDKEHREPVENFVYRAEEKWGVKFEEGYDESLRYMAHVWVSIHLILIFLTLFIFYCLPFCCRSNYNCNSNNCRSH